MDLDISTHTLGRTHPQVLLIIPQPEGNYSLLLGNDFFFQKSILLKQERRNYELSVFLSKLNRKQKHNKPLDQNDQ